MRFKYSVLLTTTFLFCCFVTWNHLIPNIQADEKAESSIKNDPDVNESSKSELVPSTTTVYQAEYVQRCEQFLNKQVESSLEGLTLEESLEELAHRHQYLIAVDPVVHDLTDALQSITIDQNFSNVKIKTFLDLTLGPHDLTYAAGKEHFIITTMDAALANPQYLSTKIYDCRDLLRQVYRLNEFDNHGQAVGTLFETAPEISGFSACGCGKNKCDKCEARRKNDNSAFFGSDDAEEGTPESLQGKLSKRYVGIKPEKVTIDISVLVETLYQQDLGVWNERNGEGGNLSTFNGMLIIRQTEQTHHKIEQFLNLLRQATFGQTDTP